MSTFINIFGVFIVIGALIGCAFLCSFLFGKAYENTTGKKL